MNKSLVVCIFLFFTLFGGCTRTEIKINYTGEKITETEHVINKNYEINVERKAYVGDPIIEVLDYGVFFKKITMITAFEAENSFNISVPNGDIIFEKGKTYLSVYSYAGGIDLIQSWIRDPLHWEVYLPISKTGEIIGNEGFFRISQKGEYKIFEHKNFKFLDKQRFVNKNGEFPKLKPLGRIRRGEKKVVKASMNEFTVKLIYTGKSKNTIKILYREFKKNMLKSPFTHELTYDLNESMVIRYKNFRIQVIEAANEWIKYKVISDADIDT